MITKIVLAELIEGKFTFLRFYERRARRILPALFVVIIASIPYAYIYMFPKAMKEYAGSLLAALTFGSNFWFWHEDSYWAEPSALKPFLHTWSLSVEEQFYLLFPITILFLWKFARKYIAVVLVLIFLSSLILAQLGSSRFASATFYFLPTRGWELLAGVLLAKLELETKRINRPFLEQTMPAIGLFMIILAAIFFHDGIRHPSFITSIPILGTMLVIWYGKKGELITDVLGSKLFVSIGLISYGLYLWHFPIFAFSTIKQPVHSQYDKFNWIILSLFLSIGTYFLVEKPVRTRGKLKTKTICIMLSFSFVCLGGVQLYFFNTDGAEFRFKHFNKLVDTNYWSDNKNYKNKFWTHKGCWLGEDTIDSNDPFKLCKSQETLSSKNRIMIIGDSNVAALIPGLIKNLGRNSIVQRVVNGCLPAIKFNNDFCRKGISAALAEIKKINPDLIILGGYYVNTKHLLQLGTLLDHDLKVFRTKVIILGPLPRWHDDGLPAKLLKIYSKYPFKLPNKLEASKDTFILDDALRKLAYSWGIEYLSPVETFCSDRKCLVRVGEKPYDITSWDIVHLTHNASNFLVEQNLDLINKFLFKSS